MRADWFGGRLVVLGAALAISGPLTFNAAEAARTRSGHSHARAIQAGMASASWGHHFRHFGRFYGGGGLQCVPFARENTGIELSGNANTWWDAAAGVYERGSKPEVGSILNFRATGHMRMGHVAVVSNVLNNRTIEIDHANWGRGRISRDMTVVDVSANNDWTAVRVGGGTGLYPTYGFIYDRPDNGTMVANTGVTPTPVAANATADSEQTIAAADAEEVAEAVDDTTPRYSRYRRSSRHASLRWHGPSGKAAVMRASYHPAASTLRGHGARRHRS